MLELKHKHLLAQLTCTTSCSRLPTQYALVLVLAPAPTHARR